MPVPLTPGKWDHFCDKRVRMETLNTFKSNTREQQGMCHESWSKSLKLYSEGIISHFTASHVAA